MNRLLILLLFLLALLASASPARADDISVAGRSVVRVVVIAFGEDGEVVGFGHGSGLRGRAEPDRHQRPCRRPGRQDGQDGVAIGVVPSEGNQAYRARVIAVDPARDLALLEVEEGTLPPIPLYRRPARRRRADRGSGLSRQCRSRHRALGRRLYHAAAADPLGRHLLQRPPDQRHHHPAPHRQHRARPFGRAAARPVRPGARRQHADHPQPGRRRALRFRGRQSRAHRLPPQARQPFQSVTTECVSMSDRLRQDQERTAAEERARQAAAATEAAQGAQTARAQRSPRSRRCARTGSRWPCCCSSSPCSPSAAAASLASRTGRSRR